MAEYPRAVPAFFLDVISLRQRWDLSPIPGQLSRALQDNLSTPVILLERPVNLNHLAL